MWIYYLTKLNFNNNMGFYKKKIVFDKRNYSLTFSGETGTITTPYAEQIFRDKIDEGFTLIKINEDQQLSINLFFKQKIKDLGIYQDLNN